MRISDWSSDVCSSDLVPLQLRIARRLQVAQLLDRRAVLDDAQHAMQIAKILRPRLSQAIDQFRANLEQRLREVHELFSAVRLRDARGCHMLDAIAHHFHRLRRIRSEEHTSDLQSLISTPYA